MDQTAENLWVLELDLPQGRYEYKFVVNGSWICGVPGCHDRNYECAECVLNAFGTLNRVVVVGR
jgi:hypothetical protein